MLQPQRFSRSYSKFAFYYFHPVIEYTSLDTKQVAAKETL